MDAARTSGAARWLRQRFGAHSRDVRLEANRPAIFTPGLQTPLRNLGLNVRDAKSNSSGTSKRTVSAPCSGCAAGSAVRRRRIREEIIGHSAGFVRARGAIARRGKFPLAMLHEPSREHRGGNLLHPLIEHRGHLLAQISGVSQTRKLIALQAVSRRGQQELPRREYVTARHIRLLSDGACWNSTRTVILVNG